MISDSLKGRGVKENSRGSIEENNSNDSNKIANNNIKNGGNDERAMKNTNITIEENVDSRIEEE